MICYVYIMHILNVCRLIVNSFNEGCLHLAMKDSMCDYDVYAFYVLQTLIDPR